MYIPPAKGIEEYISKWSEDVQERLWMLRELIMSLNYPIEEAVKWRIPFYSCSGMVCFLNNSPKRGIELVFAEGKVLPDPHGLLYDNKTTMLYFGFPDAANFPENELRELLESAVKHNLERKAVAAAAKQAAKAMAKQKPAKTSGA
ncbi:MAG: DUF1801 domain-containing protein [Bacteroidota bacterium]